MYERLVKKMQLVRLQRNATKQCRLWFGWTARCFGLDRCLRFCGERSADGFSRATQKKIFNYNTVVAIKSCKSLIHCYVSISICPCGNSITQCEVRAFRGGFVSIQVHTC